MFYSLELGTLLCTERKSGQLCSRCTCHLNIDFKVNVKFTKRIFQQGCCFLLLCSFECPRAKQIRFYANLTG